MWVVSAGLQVPPRPLEQNPSSNTGEIPHDAIRFDEAGLKAYVRDNTPRPEPVPEEPWTKGEIKSNLGWTETQLRSARANGFPKNTGHRNLFNEEGVPYRDSPAVVAGARSQLGQSGSRARGHWPVTRARDRSSGREVFGTVGVQPCAAFRAPSPPACF